MTSIPTRTCTTCHQALPATADNFGLQKNHRGGSPRLRAVCRECRAQSERERHYARTGRRPEQLPPGSKRCSRCRKVKPATAAEFITDRGQVRNPCIECSRAVNRQGYARHAPERMKRVKAWIKAHPAKHATYRATVRARRLDAPGTYTAEDVALLARAQRDRCHWCHKRMRGKYEIDHRIALTTGGTNDASNIVLAHPACNRAKNRKMPWEFAEGRLL